MTFLHTHPRMTSFMKPIALQAGLAAGVLSLIALAVRGRIETGSATRTLSAPSHWVWGEAALRQGSWSMRYTGVGILIHQLSAWLWGGLHARRDLSPDRAMKDALVTTAAAVATDLVLTPRRFTPGFERQLSPAGLVWVYGAFAVGLALAVRRRRAR